MSGSRFGPAVASLSEKVQALGTHLAILYRDCEPGRTDEATLALRAWLWMRYLDLAGYILLGDPAAQVPTRAARDVATTIPPDRVAKMEQAVIACIRHKQPPSQIARDAGVHPTTLERWVRTYQDAGRTALSGLASDDD